MVKGTWQSNKIRIQRAILLTFSGAIICGILHGYINYHQKVSEYMQSMAYREFLEAKREYQAKLMRTRQMQSKSELNNDNQRSSKN